MFWDRYEYLCKKKGKSPNSLAKEMGAGTSACTYWKNGTVPKGETLIKIAEILDCSVDYLLGRTDNPTSHKQQSLEMVSNAPINGSYNMNAGNISVSNSGLNPYQSELIGQFNKLTTIQQAKLLSFVSDIIDGKTNL